MHLQQLHICHLVTDDDQHMPHKNHTLSHARTHANTHTHTHTHTH